LQNSEAFLKKHEAMNKILLPFDLGLGASLEILKKLKVYESFKNSLYQGTKNLAAFNIKKFNRLKVTGLENLPKKGGYLIAANHQSWLDPQILAVSIPRKICFMAKSEFMRWPLLRHFIELSDSIFIRRGGDEKALLEVALRLGKGDVVCIFPEGTIPGEEQIARSAVDKNTGLLEGKTGMVRLALKAGVPIVPVGISGSGRALPPEAYPRMDITPLPKPYSIQVKIGRALHFHSHSGKNLTREQLREETKRVMKSISGLVNHAQNYIPLELPMENIPQYNKIGVLLLHGFTSSLKTVEGLTPFLKEQHIPYQMPLLRGHGTRFQDLEGIGYNDWYADAEKALTALSKTVDKVVVVGFSMGGLVGLKLAMEHPEKVAGIVTVAAALKFSDPLAGLTKLISKIIPYWPSPKAFQDKNLAKKSNQNYKWFPTKTFASLYDFSKLIEKDLPKVRVPILVIHSKKDQIISPSAANIIYEKVSSKHREIKWFYQSGHEMMQDLEAAEVLKTIDDFILKFSKKPAKAQSSF